MEKYDLIKLSLLIMFEIVDVVKIVSTGILT